MAKHVRREGVPVATRTDYFYTVIRPVSWEIARACARYLPTGWIFRGQSDAGWGLSTTFERSATRQGCNLLLPNREWWIIRQFTRRASHFINNAPDEEQYLDWLSLIQHYGGPTRLLDFSHSFYTGAFFAVETASSDCAVWALNSSALEDRLFEILNLDKKMHREKRERVPLETVNQLVGKKVDKKFTFAVEPHHMNERLAAQQGLFVVHANISAPFHDNLATEFGQLPDTFQATTELEVANAKELQMIAMLGVAIKMVIPRKSHKDAMADLRAMNVTAASLFPGLDGFARSLHWHLSLFQENAEGLNRYSGD